MPADGRLSDGFLEMIGIMTWLLLLLLRRKHYTLKPYVFQQTQAIDICHDNENTCWSPSLLESHPARHQETAPVISKSSALLKVGLSAGDVDLD